jgi:hypothetical protein
MTRKHHAAIGARRKERETLGEFKSVKGNVKKQYTYRYLGQ